MHSIILDSSLQTYALLENLLEWVASQRGSLQSHPVRINLYFIVERVFSTYLVIAKNKEIILNNKVNPNLDIYADSHMMQTFLRNLISNAIKFSCQNTEIYVQSKITGKQVEISVIDHGIGISNEKLEQLFSQKNDITTEGTAGEKGTGLGLMLCRDFVEKQGGKINVESEIHKVTSNSR